MGSVIETCTALGVSLHLNHLILVKIVKTAESPDSSSNVPKGRSVWCEVHGDRHQRHKVWQKKNRHLWDRTGLILIWSRFPLVSLFWVILDILGSQQRWEVIQPSIDQLGCACEASNLREKFSSVKGLQSVTSLWDDTYAYDSISLCKVKYIIKPYKASTSAVEPAAWIFALVWPSSCWRHLQV